MFRKALLISLLIVFSIAEAIAHTGGGKQIRNFGRLMHILEQGYEVSIVIKYAKCNLELDGEIVDDKIDAVGGMKIDVFEYFSRGVVYNEEAFVVFSESKLIKNPIGDGFVYNYVKVKIFESNKVIITAKYLNATTMDEEMSEKFYGNINNGKNDGGIFLYLH